MLTGQMERRGEKTRPPRENRRSTAALASSQSTSSKLDGIRIRFQGRQFGGRIWKIWFNLSICIWLCPTIQRQPSSSVPVPVTFGYIADGSISFRCYAGKEILWWRSGCSNLSLILVLFTCKWTVLLHVLSSMFCGNCSFQSFHYQWLLKNCCKVLKIFGLKKHYQYQNQYLLVKVWAIPVPIQKKYCQYFIAHTFYSILTTLILNDFQNSFTAG